MGFFDSVAAMANPVDWVPAAYQHITNSSDAQTATAMAAAGAGGALLGPALAGAGAAGTGAGAGTAAAAAGSSSGLGSLIPIGAGAGLGWLGQQSANQANAQQSQAQMDFQERMSDTAHQREVNDLKAAGLNPILSANSGASTPTGASAVMQNTMSGMEAAGKDMVQMKLQAQQQSAQQALMASQIANTNADTIKKGAETRALGKDAVEGDLYNWISKKAQQYSQSAAKSPAQQRVTDKADEVAKEMQLKYSAPLKGQP